MDSKEEERAHTKYLALKVKYLKKIKNPYLAFMDLEKPRDKVDLGIV